MKKVLKIILPVIIIIGISLLVFNSSFFGDTVSTSSSGATPDDGSVCKQYTNYYLFSQHTSDSDYPNTDNNDIGTYNTAYLPFPETPVKDEMGKYDVSTEQVCVQGSSNYQTGCTEIWTKEEFANKSRDVNAKDNIKYITLADGSKFGYKRNVIDETSDGIKSVIFHVEWKDGAGDVQSGGYHPVNESDRERMATAIVASAIDMKITEAAKKNYMSFEIARIYRGIDGATPMSLTNGERTEDGYFDVAVYKATYTSCTYKAKIDYVYEDGSKAAASYEKSGLEDGYEESVTPQSIDNCEPNPDSVPVKIEGDNFYQEVVYTCRYKADINYIYEDETKAADSFHREDLINGYSKEVESPPIENCLPDKNNVNININRNNFEDTVIYTCRYNAKINYVYEDGTTAKPSYEKLNLINGYEGQVTSPSIDNCTPDKENVDIKIENKQNFEDTVTYICRYKADINYIYEDETEAAEPFHKEDLINGYSKDEESPSIENCLPDKSNVNVNINRNNFEDTVTYTCRYKAKIDYVYEDGSTASDSYEKSNLKNKYDDKVTSPKIKNCTPDKNDIKVNINKANFYDKVTYTCKNEEIKDNGKTGDSSIYIFLIFSITSIIFIIYFYKRKVKNNI